VALLTLDHRDSTAAKTGSSHACPEAARLGDCDIRHFVQCFRADLEIVAQAGVAFVHQATERGAITGAERLRRGERTRVLK
jgi:hypothetical protein